MISPKLKVSANSPWRDHVAATWKFLKANYKITSDVSCSTHIHVSLMMQYSLEQVQRIAAAAIHFEEAVEALVPESRRINGSCRSSYINGPAGKVKQRSRGSLIAAIENTNNVSSVVGLMQHPGDKFYCWNFLPHFELGTIEFRKPPPSETLADALGWAEFAINFVQASLSCGTSDKLRNFQPNVGGLRRFLRRVSTAGVNEPRRLERIWRGHRDEEAVKSGRLSPPKQFRRPGTGSGEAAMALPQ
jgi:Putative amidoligase enzyme